MGIEATEKTLKEISGNDKLKIKLPEEIRLKSIRADQTLSAMLAEGEIDALVTARTPSTFLSRPKDVKRLFPDYVEAEKAYYRRTKIFPIMHVVVIRREIYEKNRWVAQALYKGFVKAKELAMRRLTTYPPLHATLPWLTAHIEHTQKIMGKDYWSYGLAENRHVLETAARHAWEQGLLEKPIANIDELFAPETHAGVQDIPT